MKKQSKTRLEVECPEVYAALQEMKQKMAKTDKDIIYINREIKDLIERIGMIGSVWYNTKVFKKKEKKEEEKGGIH